MKAYYVNYEFLLKREVILYYFYKIKEKGFLMLQIILIFR
jgi:hypothetical protein